ncbi:MAG: hypothetical protein FJY98_00600 [Candidatus Liptonbacteria bacterium]|nr:hypothetical protein [Candidatus Liptonbacteria bacterium]
MATVVTPPEGGGNGTVLGVILGILIGAIIILFIMYGLPAMRGTPQTQPTPQEQPDINLRLNLPGGGSTSSPGTSQ